MSNEEIGIADIGKMVQQLAHSNDEASALALLSQTSDNLASLRRNLIVSQAVNEQMLTEVNTLAATTVALFKTTAIVLRRDTQSRKPAVVAVKKITSATEKCGIHKEPVLLDLGHAEPRYAVNPTQQHVAGAVEQSALQARRKYAKKETNTTRPSSDE